MTLDQDKQRFAEWRSQRQRRQPISPSLMNFGALPAITFQPWALAV